MLNRWLASERVDDERRQRTPRTGPGKARLAQAVADGDPYAAEVGGFLVAKHSVHDGCDLGGCAQRLLASLAS